MQLESGHFLGDRGTVWKATRERESWEPFQLVSLRVTFRTLSLCTHVKITRQWKSTLRKEFALPQTLSRLFHLVSFVKCWQFFLELNSKGLYQSSAKEKESCCLARVKITPPEKRRHATGREKNDFSLSPPRVAFSRVGWFSRALAFRTLYYPWGQMGDYS